MSILDPDGDNGKVLYILLFFQYFEADLLLMQQTVVLLLKCQTESKPRQAINLRNRKQTKEYHLAEEEPYMNFVFSKRVCHSSPA